MLARLLRLFLLFEAFAYLAAGIVMVGLFAWRPVVAISLLIVFAVAWRTWTVVMTYLFAWGHQPPVQTGFRIGRRRALREGFDEVAAFAALMVAHAFDRFVLKRDAPPRPSTGTVPMLLIHGYCSNRGFWWWLKPRLEARGCSVGTLSLEPMFGSIDGYAQQVARRVDALCRETGAERIMLVGHSMGGLVCRAYLRRYGASRVCRLLTLGTPHRGTVLARLGIGRNSREMEPGNAWLRELEVSPLQVPCIAYYSTHDNHIVPYDSGALQGADNRPLAGVGHLAMSISPLILVALSKSSAIIDSSP